MPNVKNNASAQETRRLLIDAAGAVFASCGLHASKIKDITDRAGVNLAAVNYHFSDKFELYAAVIRHALASKCLPPDDPPGATPAERLRSFVRHVIDDIYDTTRPAWIPAVLAHEFATPTAALTSVIEELIRPRVQFVNAIIRDILGPAATEAQVLRAGTSVASQCFVLVYNGEVIRRLHPGLLREEQRQAIVDHIYEFSLAGLKAMRRASRQARARRKRPAARSA